MPGARETKKAAADSPEVLARIKLTLDLPRICAFKVRRQTGVPSGEDDLESMGREGLLDAARTYSPDYGIPFRNWAYLKIRGAIIDGLRKQADLPRPVYRKLRALEAANLVREAGVEEESAAASETTESADKRIADVTASMAMAMAAGFLYATRGVPETLADERAVSPEAAAMERNLLERIKAAIDRRPEGERKLLTRVYFDGATVEEASKEQGLSKSWGCRLHARALEAVAVEVRAAARKGEEE